MIAAFLIGLGFFAFGAGLSLLTGTWQICFAFSCAISGVSILCISILRNSMIIVKKKNEQNNSMAEGELWMRRITVFSFPSIAAAVILYFMLYR